MKQTLKGLQWVTCLVYIDDIICFGRNFREHIDSVTAVLQRITDAGLKLRPDKCQLLKTEVVFLGHVVSGDGVRPNPTNVAKIVTWPTPQCPKKVKQFVATASYYRRFIRFTGSNGLPFQRRWFLLARHRRLRCWAGRRTQSGTGRARKCNCVRK